MDPNLANVIAFPQPSGRQAAQEAAPDLVSLVVSSILRLGEPATAAEILADLASLGIGPAGWTLQEAGALLRAYSQQGLERLADECLFQKVTLGAQEAWAFTPALRQPLRESGLSCPLRKTL
jgi:hypothetical protein